ncbi:DUF6843 domain-containing protein [Tenacibaculum bernardetii]|uniref:DUF6843 domain-containing protein n=1 Tax=Tenacibaculum bernardetii TaxID=3021375 RepID=UPI0023AF9735|nr:hypothetical protein [Tenacibaculum bernardetii]
MIFFIIAIPIFTIGLVIISLNKRKLKIKLSYILGSILFIVSYWIIWININRTDAETFLIPEELTGKVTIIYGSKSGINPLVQNGRKILNIPKEGTLYVNYEYKSGFIDHEYYSISNNGEKTKMEFYNKSEAKKSPRIELLVTGNSPGKIGNDKYSTKSSLTTYYMTFNVVRE